LQFVSHLSPILATNVVLVNLCTSPRTPFFAMLYSFLT
jgi:hypothetical protein